jgi:hypothetical protein
MHRRVLHRSKRPSEWLNIEYGELEKYVKPLIRAQRRKKKVPENKWYCVLF